MLTDMNLDRPVNSGQYHSRTVNFARSDNIALVEWRQIALQANTVLLEACQLMVPTVMLDIIVRVDHITRDPQV